MGMVWKSRLITRQRVSRSGLVYFDNIVEHYVEFVPQMRMPEGRLV
jgi:hypothetical protein